MNSGIDASLKGRPSSLSVEEALSRITAQIHPVSGWEQLSLHAVLDRVLAEDIDSPIDVPGHNNSAMDGYAVAVSGLSVPGERQTFRVAGTSLAGHPFAGTVPPGECVRIMTGAVVPRGTDTVIMQEAVEVADGIITVANPSPRGDNVRRAGEDLRRGQRVLNRGKRLTPADIGLLASLGIGEVSVVRRVRVAFFSTGDELCSLGEPLAEGKVYDSNRHTLHAMLVRLGADVIDMGVVRDQREAIAQAFAAAADMADVVITSGGVSVGDADFVKDVLGDLGQIDFWRVAMRPGRPLAFGRMGQSVFFGLPGNPVSTMVTFYQFVQPALRVMMGEPPAAPLLLLATCTSPIKKRAGRKEFQRGVMQRDASGQLTVSSTGAQGSGILSSMSAANCFIHLPAECQGIEPGESVTIQPFAGLI